MEIIVFFVIYLVYSLFERLVKKMREEQAKTAPPRKQPGAPQQQQRGSTPQPQQPAETKPAEELEELPRMLREILGMDIEEKKRPATPPPPPPPPIATPVEELEDTMERKAEEVEEYFARDMTSSTLEAFASKKSQGKTTVIGGDGKSGGKVSSRSLSIGYGTSAKSILGSRKLIHNKKELRKAILLKEILDRPFGLRGKPSPYIQP